MEVRKEGGDGSFYLLSCPPYSRAGIHLESRPGRDPRMPGLGDNTLLTASPPSLHCISLPSSLPLPSRVPGSRQSGVSHSTTYVSHPDFSIRSPISFLLPSCSTSVTPLLLPQASPRPASIKPVARHGLHATCFATAPSQIPLERKRGVVAESCATFRRPEVAEDHGVDKGADRSKGGMCIVGVWVLVLQSVSGLQEEEK